MKAKIFVGPRDTGKTRVAEMLADHVGRDNTLFIDPINIMRNNPFTFSELNEDIKLIIFDGCSVEFDYRKFYDVNRINPYAPQSFKIDAQAPMAPIRTFSVPQLIFIANEIDEDLANSGASFNSSFEVIRFPLNKKQQ